MLISEQLSAAHIHHAHEFISRSAYLHLRHLLPHERAILSHEATSIYRLGQHAQLHGHLGITIVLDDLLLLYTAPQVLPHATLAKRLTVPLLFSVPPR
jgi:hypothetical protein